MTEDHVVMIALSTPFGKYVDTAVQNTTTALPDTAKDKAEDAGGIIDILAPDFTFGNESTNHGIYFGLSYVGSVLEMGNVSLVFYNNGTVEAYVETNLLGIYTAEDSDGIVNVLELGSEGTIENSGKQILVPSLGTTFVLKEKRTLFGWEYRSEYVETNKVLNYDWGELNRDSDPPTQEEIIGAKIVIFDGLSDKTTITITESMVVQKISPFNMKYNEGYYIVSEELGLWLQVNLESGTDAFGDLYYKGFKLITGVYSGYEDEAVTWHDVYEKYPATELFEYVSANENAYIKIIK